MSVYDTLVKRLSSWIDTTSVILQNLLDAIANQITELDTEINNADELNQSKKKLRQMLNEWSLSASHACSVENLQHALKHRINYHNNRGSEFGILDDIDLLCNSGANIIKDPPCIEWYLGINYPFWGDESPLDYSGACYGYLIDLGFAIQFAKDNDLLSEDEIKEIICKHFIPVHLDVLLDISEDSYNYLMLENELNVW